LALERGCVEDQPQHPADPKASNNPTIPRLAPSNFNHGPFPWLALERGCVEDQPQHPANPKASMNPTIQQSNNPAPCALQLQPSILASTKRPSATSWSESD
jgi:hypothetical protein